MKKLGFAAILAVSVLLSISCGKIDWQKTENKEKENTIKIRIEVDVGWYADPTLIINAKKIEVDRPNYRFLVVGAAFLKNPDGFWAWNEGLSAIQVDNAVFSVPLGGKITIVYPDGQYEILERYGNYTKTEQLAYPANK